MRRPATARQAALGVWLLLLAPPAAVAAEVTVTAAETSVRTAPFDVAPALGRLHPGDELPAQAAAQPGWLQVRLPDGRRGFIHATDARWSGLPRSAAAAAPARPPSAALPPSPYGPAVVLSPEPGPAPGRAGPVLVGVAFEILPAGRFETGSGSGDLTADADVTTAVAPFLDVPLSPWFEIGVSPQFVFKVKASGATQSAIAYDLRARLTARYPTSPRTRLFLRLSPGYSYLSLPQTTYADVSSPAGFAVDFSAGSEIALLPSMVLVVDIGYQLGFQSTSVPGGTIDENFDFLHLGVGFALGL